MVKIDPLGFCPPRYWRTLACVPLPFSPELQPIYKIAKKITVQCPINPEAVLIVILIHQNKIIVVKIAGKDSLNKIKSNDMTANK